MQLLRILRYTLLQTVNYTFGHNSSSTAIPRRRIVMTSGNGEKNRSFEHTEHVPGLGVNPGLHSG